MTEELNLIIGFCWYQREEWEMLKQCAADPERLDDSYEDWRSGANSAIQDLKEQGMNARKVSVKVSELIEWCNERGYKLDGKARSEYATYLISKRV